MKQTIRQGKESYVLRMLMAIFIGVTCMWLGSCFVIYSRTSVNRQAGHTFNAFAVNATDTDYIAGSFRKTAFVSAQMPLNSTNSTNITMEVDIGNQTNQTLINLHKAITNTGGFLKNVLKVNVFMFNITQQDKVLEVSKEYFEEADGPAVTFVQVKSLPKLVEKQVLVSMEAIVALP